MFRGHCNHWKFNGKNQSTGQFTINTHYNFMNYHDTITLKENNVIQSFLNLVFIGGCPFICILEAKISSSRNFK